MITAAVSACVEGESGPAATEITERTDQASERPATTSTEAGADNSSAPQANGPLLRSAGYYRLEWQNDADLCAKALATLNKPYARGVHSTGTEDLNGRGYALRQVARMLGTDDNVNWSRSEATVGIEGSGVAEFDYFNDGINRLIVRMHGRLSGADVISLGIVETPGESPTLFSIGHAGANTENLSPQDNLHTKLTYSVVDVVRLEGEYYTLAAPLEDVDASERVYLVRWAEKDGRSAPRGVDDYYPTVACIYQPSDASQATSEQR